MRPINNFYSKRLVCLISVLSFICLSPFESPAQRISADSLKSLLKTAESDSLRGHYYLQLAHHFRRSDNERAQKYLDTARSIEEYERHEPIKHRLDAAQAKIFDVASKYDSAASIYKKMLMEIGDNFQDSLFVSDQYYALGNTLRKWGKNEEAIQTLQKSKDIALKIDDQFIVGAVDVGLGIIYKNSGQYEQALKYYEEGYRIFKKLDDHDNMATCILNLANLLGRQGKHEEALLKYDEAYSLAQKLENNEGLLAYIYGNMGNAYTQLDRDEEALKYARLSYELRKSRSDPIEKATSLIGMAISHKDLGQPNQAITLLEEAKEISESADGMLEVKQRINETLYLLYRSENQLEKAMDAQSNYVALKDSVRNVEMDKKVLELNEQLETERKEKEIVRLNAKNEIADSNLKTARRQTYGLLGGLFVFAILLFGLLKLYRKTQFQNAVISKALSEKETLLREIHHRVKNNLQFISSLLRLQTEHVNDQKALGALQEGQDRVQSMALIHQNLYQEDNLTGVNIHDYFVKLVRNLFDSYNVRKGDVDLQLNIEQLNLDVDTVIPIGLVVNELVSNSLKYAFPKGRKGVISVDLKEANGQLHVIVADDGIGMTEVAKTKLGSSFGFRLIEVFKEQLEAELVVDNNNGTKVTLIISDYETV